MARIGFPIDVVVIHRANHVTIQKSCVDWIGLKAGDECRCFSISAAHRAIMFEQNLRVFLLTSTQGAADGIEPEQFRRLNCFGREMFIFKRASPFRDDVRQQTFRFSVWFAI